MIIRILQLLLMIILIGLVNFILAFIIYIGIKLIYR